MKEFRGTKGEWVFDEPSCKIRHKGSFIEIADTYKSYCEYGENTANANLIAAAPELLDHLVKVTEYLDDVAVYEDAQELINAARAAIYKALGK